ncbi:probable F-box protein At1g65740 [Panicum virgatum]|uniref:probable F-box protein At1g65740 n=1 Tax=Panicum virgatum TaxID=38727 RepID=UPI0019D5CF9F|nr:probable F-box protein At1g65740 [Panicum virgatum]
MGAWLCKASPASSPLGWPSLLPELADLVLRRLPSLADRVRFASACRHWRHAMKQYSLPSLPRPLPWLNFSDGRFRSLPDGELHSFQFRKPTDTLCVGCFDNWLLFDELSCIRPSLRHYLKNPLRRATRRLPGVRSSSRSTDFRIRKVIICSRDLVVAKVNYQHGPCAVVCCRPGTSSSWSTGLCNGLWYQDMAFYGGKIYTVTIEGDLFAHEVSNGTADTEEGPAVSRVERVIQVAAATTTTPANCATRCYLVISCTGKLLMVWWIVVPEKSTTTFKVFEADFRMSRWLEVESLGDEVLFVSSSCSRAVAASSHGDYLQGNRIYFLDDSIASWFFGTPSNQPACGVYDVSSSTIHPIPLGQQWHLSSQSKASWFFP